MKPLEMLFIPLLLLFAGAHAAAGEPLLNADISAGDCEQDCTAVLLLGKDQFLLWKGDKRPKLLLPLGPAPSEVPPTTVRGEINTDDCVASCEKDLLVADLELTVRRDADGHISGVWVREVRLGTVHRIPAGAKPMQSPAVPKQDPKAAVNGPTQGSCVGGRGTGPGDVECRITRTFLVQGAACVRTSDGNWWLVVTGVWVTFDCVGRILDRQPMEYVMPAIPGYTSCR